MESVWSCTRWKVLSACQPVNSKTKTKHVSIYWLSNNDTIIFTWYRIRYFSILIHIQSREKKMMIQIENKELRFAIANVLETENQNQTNVRLLFTIHKYGYLAILNSKFFAAKLAMPNRNCKHSHVIHDMYPFQTQTDFTKVSHSLTVNLTGCHKHPSALWQSWFRAIAWVADKIYGLCISDPPKKFYF